MSEMTWSSYTDGPRTARVADALKNGVHVTPGLTLTYLEVDKRWLNETVRFTVVGEERIVLAFQKSFLQSIREWNTL